MRDKNRTKTAPEILRLVAKEGPKSKWQMKKATGKSYGNIHQTVKELLERGLIKKESIQPSKKNPKMKVEYYSLTLSGLISVLSDGQLWSDAFKNDKYDEVETIIKRNRDIHPLLQKWDHLSRNIQKHELMSALLATVMCLRRVEGDLKDAFTEFFFSLILEPSFYASIKVDMEGWIKAIKGDDELRKYILKKLRSKRKLYQQFNSSTKRFIKQLEETEVSDKSSSSNHIKGEKANPIMQILHPIWKMRFFHTLGHLYVKTLDEKLIEDLRTDLSNSLANIYLAAKKCYWLKYFNLRLKYKPAETQIIKLQESSASRRLSDRSQTLRLP